MTWRGEKYCPYWDSNSDLSADEPVASRYTDCSDNRKIKVTEDAGREGGLSLTSLTCNSLTYLLILRQLK
jgi:hypothetical protein